VREARRIAPMAAGIVWGVASVFVLVALGRGFEETQRRALEALGDAFLLLRVNRSTTTRGDVRANAFVRLDGEDMQALEENTPSIEALSPKASNWFIRAFHGGNVTRATAIGVEPQYERICNVPLEPGGRWIDENDMQRELKVCVLGYTPRLELFGDEPYLGKEVLMTFTRDGGAETVLRRMKVIGALRDEELAGDEIYTSHRQAIFLPFTTWERVAEPDFQFFVLRPKSAELKEQALQEAREVLGARHGFPAEDRNALAPYFDAIQRKQQIDGVFGRLEVFFGAVGILILLLGAIGVANVVLMSVTARTFEFGLRRALGCKRRWIFAQVFLEAAIVCLLSGALGFALGFAAVEVVGGIELPEGFAPPRAELEAAYLPGALLLMVGLAAAAWPATRAALLSPVAALHRGKL
jgi:putative ABC transport system permease protein